MIVRETIEINGKQYDYTYSDSGKRISRDGVSYDTAIDPLDSGRVYVESDDNTALTVKTIYPEWEAINETHSGTADDPIPYDGNMAMTAGLYYVQDYVVYLCTRDTVNPVYNALSELVGIYVEVVNG